MKKIIVFLLGMAVAGTAFARGFSNQRIHHQPTPPPPVVATSTPPAPSSLQFGMFNGSGNTKYGTISAFFIGDGDSFTEDYQGLKLSGPLWVYWESSLTATQIANGSADSFLKGWATQMKAYGKQIYFAPLDEMNGNWNPYYGNPTAFKAAWVHIHSLFSGDTNIKFAYDPNVCGPGIPCSSISGYYPGSAYVDIVGLDGFDFGGQTFSQVFSGSILPAQALNKELWITSTGVVASDNQSAFLEAALASKVSGIIYFDYQQFVLGSSALSTLSSMLQ